MLTRFKPMFRPVEASSPREQVALGTLFVSFLKVSLLGFGGGLVWARRVVVEQQAWLDDQEFAEIDSLPVYAGTEYRRHHALRWGEIARDDRGDHRRRRFHPYTVDGRTGAGRTMSALCSPRGPAKRPRRALRRCSRSDDRDRDPALAAASQSPNGLALCRAGLRRHGIDQTATLIRPARPGAGQH